jgi:inhibitor of KinA
VVYDGEDLSRVASCAGLSVGKIIELHGRPRYTVAMIGFLPHFPYLIGMDERLATPRLSDPRKRVPAGSVAIGGAQTGIYPSESPGGWNLIGRMDPRLLSPLRPGDTIVFEAVEKI